MSKRVMTRLRSAGAIGISLGFCVVGAFAAWALMSAPASAQSFKDDDFAVMDHGVPFDGCYVGIAGGAALDNTSTIVSAPVDGVSGAASDGFTASAYAGCNRAFGPVLLGIEGDFGFASNGPDYLASIRGRVGVPVGGTTLIYGTYGYAIADQSYTALSGGVLTEVSDGADGYVFGGGIEQAIGSNGALRLEALEYRMSPLRFSPGVGDGARVRQSTTVIRVGLTIGFSSLFGGGFSSAGVDPDVIQ